MLGLSTILVGSMACITETGLGKHDLGLKGEDSGVLLGDSPTEGGVGGDTATTVPDSLGLDTTCTAAAKKLCAKLGDCSPYKLKRTYGDVAKCEERQAIRCNGLADLAATPAAIDACFSAYTCEDLLNPTAKDPAACAFGKGVLSGGKGCVFDGQCKSNRCRDGRSYHDSCGTCEPDVPPGKVGELCGDPTLHCVSGAHCAYDSSAAKDLCTRDKALGEACTLSKSDANPCGPVLMCSPTTATCVPKFKVGEACLDSFFCERPLTCEWDGGSKKCTAVTPFAKKGAACSVGGAQCDWLNQGLVCDAKSHTCVDYPVVGATESCTAASCAASGMCANGATCVKAPKEGEACGYINSNPDPRCMPPAVCDRVEGKSTVCKVFSPNMCPSRE
ncbi:MAG: hypothetical protein NVS3B20_02870 [Polyangiales bacterium]